MQKLQDSVFSIVKTTNLSSAVFSFLQPAENYADKTPLGGILRDSKHGWLALGPKFCVVDLRTGLKVAAKIFGDAVNNHQISVTSVIELPTPLTDNSQQLIISLQCEDTSLICVLHINGSQILRCIQTEVVITEMAVCDRMPDGSFTCFDGVVMAGTKSGEIIAFDLNRACLLQALKDISQGYEHLVRNELAPANLSFLPLNAVQQIDEQRELALENGYHLAVLLNESSLVSGQYIFRNPDGTVRMKAKRDHIRVTVLEYIPQLASLAVGFNFGAFQIWNLMTLELEYTSQVNVECLPVTHFGFQEPCDDPRAFCYLWVVFSVIDRFEEEEFPLAVMYSLTYQGKRMLSDTKCLYQEFSNATIRFQVDLSGADDAALLGGKCISCHTYSVNSTLGSEGEDSMLNICQLVWECWGENANSSSQYGMVLFDLDQWYKDQMPATYQLESSAFMSATWCPELGSGCSAALDVRLDPASVSVYCHSTRLEEHFYPNSLQYSCICLNTSEACVLSTIGIQRQIISSLDEVGPTALLNPPRLYAACVAAGLAPLYTHTHLGSPTPEEQRRFLLSVALEARLTRLLKRCAHDWATGSHSGAGCTLTFLIDWCWTRAIELKENAKELTAPLFVSSSLPDRNVVRCLEHCVQQLTQLTGLLDAVITKCCNLVVPDALSEMEEKHKGIGTVSMYFQVVQWFLRVGLLPERHDAYEALSYPAQQLYATYNKRRLKLNRLQENSSADDNGTNKSCSLLYIDQLIEHEFGGERIHEMWIKGGSECNGLYPPPSLYSLLRLYLLPDIAEEHKHSLVLYLLVDYSMVYDEVRYEAVIRRLMQFPTMFGLSNTAIKATQAFWHLDHRDFDFALDQLQCLTGNTLSEWQHHVVLSSLLAQKKTQAALQYLHVRKPAPIQNATRDKDGDSVSYSNNRVNDHDKLEDWQSCVNLYLARGLVYEGLDVIRMCVRNAGTLDEKLKILNFFFKGCRNTGHLSKLLQVTLQSFEEEVFIKYLESCNEAQTSDILIMYYLQQARYLEAEQYNSKLKHSKHRGKDMSTSVESLFDVLDRESARDTIVEVVCSSLPNIANTVAHCAFTDRDVEAHVIAPKPMSVFVQAKSPINTFTYKSSFIQDTIENASETWMNRPKMRRGLKRALNIEETPFICTPKQNRTRSIFTTGQNVLGSTPPKRAKLDLTGTPKTPNLGNTFRMNETLSSQMATLLDMPDVQSPECKIYNDRTGAETPHSILKIRRNEDLDREAPSPVDSRYLGDSDEELETASNHTHFSDSTNKHLRFTIPTCSESGSTPSPRPGAPAPAPALQHKDVARETERSTSTTKEREMDISNDSFVTTTSHPINETHPLESPPKKLATEDNVKSRKSYKDTVFARRSLSISANSSLSDDPNTSIESIADIPITLINPRYSGGKRHKSLDQSAVELHDETAGGESVVDAQGVRENEYDNDSGVKEMDMPRTPRGRRGIRAVSGESTPLINRSRSSTPERQDSPMVTPLRSRITRSRSRTPERSPRSSPLDSIPEQPKQETESELHAEKSLLSIPRQLRSRSRTPDRTDKGVIESPRLEPITESPMVSPNTESSPTRRSLRSRSRTPEVEVVPEPIQASPRSLRSRSKTPEKLLSPKIQHSARKKPLSRLVLEANTFAKTKLTDKTEVESTVAEDTDMSVIECTPMKSVKQVSSLMDVTLSPIVNKSVLQSSNDSALSETVEKDKADKTELGLKPLPAFTTIHETYFEKSVLRSYQSSIADTSECVLEIKESSAELNASGIKRLPAFTNISDIEMGQSVLKSYESSVAESSSMQESKIDAQNVSKPFAAFAKMIETDFERSVLRSYQSSIEEAKEDKKDTSSLITNDSDVEMKGDEWKADADSRDTAAVIQKEKERIVEIEREINEIEGDMSDDESDRAGDDGSSDEEIVEGDAEETEESDTSDEASGSESDEEIISIQDTDSDESTSSDNRLQIDEQPDSNKQPSKIDTEQILETIIEVQVENDRKETASLAANEASSIDPLNQAQVSLMTEETDQNLETVIEVQVENDRKEPDSAAANETSSIDPMNLAQVSFMTDDNSVVESDVSNIKLNYSNEEIVEVKNKGEPAVEKEAQSAVQIQVTIEEPTTNSKTKEQAFSTKDIDVAVPLIDVKEVDTKMKSVEETIHMKTGAAEDNNKEAEAVDTSAAHKETQTIQDEERKTSTKEKSALRSSKRAKSTSSNKSVDEPKTPATRKHNASDKSASETEQKTPENQEVTPSRRRVKTPTSSEVRKIITRRVSREMGGLLDDSKTLDESILTPKRRSTRSRSKNIDDNESVASESSVISSKSKASEVAGDIKPSQGRKGRKSILATKPDLCVIPEVIVEEPSAKETGDVINEYSSSRRLNPAQTTVVEPWLEPKPSPKPARRISTNSRASRTSVISEQSNEDDDASSTHSAFDVQPIDRISLLNKTDFEGSPDADELQNDLNDLSPGPSVTDASKQRRSRLGRAASESRALPKPAKIGRRISVDVVDSPERDSPARGRRASFNRACEALHTPKGRRTSTDLRKGETDSPQDSPGASEADAPVTPSRRPRRASTQSNTSQANSETGKKSKKLPTLEEVKDNTE